jgi:hypothetical protein
METLVKKFKKLGTADLLRRVDKLTGDEQEACKTVLRQRGQLPVHFETEEETPATGSEEPTGTDLPKGEEPEKTTPVELSAEKPAKRPKLKRTLPEDFRFKIGDKVKFTVAKNSKKAPGKELVGKIVNYVEDKGKIWLRLQVNEIGTFLKESSKCS